MDAKADLLLRLTNDIPSHQPIFLFVMLTLPIELTSIIVYLLKTSKKDSMNITRLVKTKLIKTSQPPTDKFLPFQLLSFISILCSIIFQSLLLHFL
jgi:hypothetical protein